MKKILLTLIGVLVLTTVGLAQGTKPQPAINLAAIEGGGSAITPKTEEKDASKAPSEASSAYVNRQLDGLLEEKAKPVIISNAKKQELVIASLQLENAKLRLKEFQAEVAKAEDNVAAFWKSIGIDPTKLATDWQASDGQNGDIILTRKEPEKKPDAPKQ